MKKNTLKRIMDNGVKAVYGNLEETLPEYLLEEYNLIDINRAIKNIHFPESFEEYNKARQRLVFEELLVLQLALLNLKNSYAVDETGIAFSKDVHMSDVINRIAI